MGRDDEAAQRGEASPAALGEEERLRRVVLRASGVAWLGVPVALLVFGPSREVRLEIPALVGLLCVALSTRRPVPRTAAFACFALLWGITLVAAFRSLPWIPIVVFSLANLVVGTGLLRGARRMYLLLVALGALLFGGAAAVAMGLRPSPMSSAFDPTVATNWWRVATNFALFVGTSAIMLGNAVAGAARAAGAAHDALEQSRVALAAAEGSRRDRLREERALLDAQKLQTVAQLGDGFTHLLTNVLTILRGAVDEVRADPSADVRARAVAAIREAIAGCVKRTQGLVVLSRPHDRVDALARGLDVAVREAMPRLARQLREDVTVHLRTAPTGALALPPSWLDQVLLNLLLNASQAKDGAVILEVVAEERTVASDDARPRLQGVPLEPGTYLVIEVKDDGPGMTPAVAARACDPFFTTRGRAGHDGLGLTLVRSMAARFGGGVSIASSPVGSTVTVWFAPGRRASSASMPDVPGAPETPAPAGAPRGDPGARPPVDPSPSDWREAALDEVLGAATLAFVFIFLAVLLLVTGRAMVLGSTGLALALLFVAWRARSSSFQLRLALAVGALVGLGGLHVVNLSFLAPAPIMMLVTAAYLTAVFAGRRATVAVILVGVATFLVGGHVWSTGLHVGAREGFVGDRPADWLRVGIVIPSALAIVATAVLRVFRLAHGRIAELGRARAELEASREAYQRATEALVEVETMRAKATGVADVGRVTSTIAHDLNNHFTTMVLLVDLLENPESPSDVDDALTILEEATAAVEATIERLQQGADQGHAGPSLDLGHALAQLDPMLQAIARGGPTPCTLVVEKGEGAFVTIRDESFRRLVVNLVTNARDAVLDRAGRVGVRLACEGSRVVLSVGDDGVGMDAQTKARAFDAFFTTKQGRGTGLGLASVGEIARATGAEVRVDSAPGDGSVFTLAWPLGSAPPAKARARTVAKAEGGRARVLYAEDEALLRALVERGLRAAGYDTVACESAEAASKALDGQTFDALVTDAIMPGRPVSELVALFRAKNPGRPVLVVSGHVPEHLASLLRGEGAVPVLRKPFRIAALVDRLAELLAAT